MNKKKEIIKIIVSSTDKQHIYEDFIINSNNLIEDLEIDSLHFINLIVGLEESFKITIPDEILVVDTFNTFDKIHSLITQLQS
ncbi:acyl carrier protein [Salipaludibacillus neizhouensis]|uniref:Acyl carrier protein n=1 Tax=Salipaludibacillus neizhouensis TaxID=885475 RepID=A0A3A9K132_9BACI|nr:phosphopantetheine-binding protein [Salipaludibacillus neizhouensis]RKL64948.1 acyl carrier protein [Salipaludibacillus neizhouensis]